LSELDFVLRLHAAAVVQASSLHGPPRAVRKTERRFRLVGTVVPFRTERPSRSVARDWQNVRYMSSRIRVADAHDLPPGKGRVVEVAGRQFTVFNRDGRFYATTTHAPRRAPLAGDTSDTCAQRGLGFEVWMEDSPAHLHGEERCLVRIDDEGVWLIVG
jgi:hypothetical protein